MFVVVLAVAAAVAAVAVASGVAPVRAASPVVSTYLECHGWFCERASLEVLRWPNVLGDDGSTVTLGTVFPASHYDLAASASVFTAFDAKGDRVLLGVVGGPMAQGQLWSVDPTTPGKNSSVALPSTYNGASLSAMEWDATSEKLLLLYGGAVVALDPTTGKFTNFVPKLWPSTDGYAPWAGILALDAATDTLVAAAVRNVSGNGQEWAYVMCNTKTKAIKMSPWSPTTATSAFAWQPAFLQAGPGGFLMLGTSSLGASLYFVNPATLNATKSVLTFSDFAGLGWSPSATPVTGVTSPFLTWDSNAGQLLGIWSIGSGSSWTGIAIPSGSSTPVGASTGSYVYPSPVAC